MSHAARTGRDALAVAKSFPACFHHVWRHRMRHEEQYIWGRIVVSLVMFAFVPLYGAEVTTIVWVVGAMWTLPETADAVVRARVQARQQRRQSRPNYPERGDE